jgi:hypothetical protein
MVRRSFFHISIIHNVVAAAYVELSVFLRHLPEKYSTVAYSVCIRIECALFLTRMIQIFALQSANIYPCLYMLLNAREQRVQHKHTIYGLLLIGIIASVLMSQLWAVTATIGGQRHSVGTLPEVQRTH